MPLNINDINLLNEDVLRWMKMVRLSCSNLQVEYNLAKGLILTEGDLECALYRQLIVDHDEFQLFREEGVEGLSTRKIHSQVTWFKENEFSGFRMDLTILNPQNLNISRLDAINKYPNKGFFHDGETLGVEIKFIRDSTSSAILSDVEEDIIHVINSVLPAKYAHIRAGTYQNADMNSIGFTIVIGCKTQEIFREADVHLSALVRKMGLLNYNFLDVILFSPDQFKGKEHYRS